jgi:hypothetical protein
MNEASRRNERSPKIFKIKVPIFRKKMQKIFITIRDQKTRYKISLFFILIF